MMSNPPSSLQTRQRLHRRQNSTPVAFEAMKVQHPATIQRQNNSQQQHKRGQSFDSRSPIRRHHNHTGSMVSIANIGSTPTGQQILREAQQQRLARPGQQPIELPVSPQCGIYQSPSNSSLPGSPFDVTMNAIMQNPSCMVAHSPYLYQDMNMPLSAGLPMGVNLDENNQHYFQNSHLYDQNMGMMPIQDRRMSHPELRIQTSLRPLTPTQQTHTAHFPLTPAATPFRAQTQMQYSRSMQSLPTQQQFQHDSIQAPRPVSMQKSRSLQGIVEQDEIPSNSTKLQTSSFEVADMPFSEDYTDVEPVKQQQARLQLTVVPQLSRSQQATPKQEESLPIFDEETDDQPILDDKPVPLLPSSTEDDDCLSPRRPALSPRRMSISDLNLEPGISASIEETNVTLDDIAQFIEGPDPVDNKWICKYDDCNKRFGRKENIKSHVQTHLGDRQFRCDHCKKCFVRGHDLKRHAKIHTGTKPYPCLCGNAFARHDALTRHRQRGMCIGAFDGIVKKIIKRGRPRKHRPEMDERVDKASKSRRNMAEHYDQYASSSSSCSMSSWGSPPTETMDALSIQGQSPYDEMNLFDMPAHNIQATTDNMAFPPNMFSYTPPASPGYSAYSTGNKPSPLTYRELTPAELASISGEVPSTATVGQPIPVLNMPNIDHTSESVMTNPIVLQASQQSLPSLSHSGSSPAADAVVFDLSSDDPTMCSVQSMGMDFGTSMKYDRNDFDSFLDYTGIEMSFDGSAADNFFSM